MSKVDITILVPVKNEEKNIEQCLAPITDWAEKVLVIDSGSEDKTEEISTNMGADVLQFDYKGGWPKKRQFVLDTYSFTTGWVLLLDCDEILTEESKKEIEEAIVKTDVDGFYLFFRMEFLGRMLRYADPGLRKLSLFRTGKGGYEMRLQDQDSSMADMEIHEHVVVKGKTENLNAPILHRNFNNMSRYIIKHDEYSNYDAFVQLKGSDEQLKAKLFGSIEQRRRWIKKNLIRNPFSPFFYFIYMYVFRFGFLDRKPGFFYILYQCMYLYFVSSKMYEAELEMKNQN